ERRGLEGLEEEEELRKRVGIGSTADPNTPLKYGGVRAMPPPGSRVPRQCYRRFWRCHRWHQIFFFF
ncbi:unnamed protein product, partial [Musa textilis]